MWIPDARASFAPDARVSAGLVGLGILLAAVAVRADAGGRLLGLVAAVGLLALGVRDLLCRPVLAAAEQGLLVRTGARPRAVPWADVLALRVRRERRTQVLELDLTGGLVVLSGRRLGTRPEAALAVLERWRDQQPAD